VSKIILSKNFIRGICKLALNEDLYPSGDITSSLLNDNIKKKLKLITNQNGVIGGLEFAKQTFKLIDNKIKFDIKCFACQIVFQKIIGGASCLAVDFSAAGACAAIFAETTLADPLFAGMCGVATMAICGTVVGLAENQLLRAKYPDETFSLAFCQSDEVNLCLSTEIYFITLTEC
jgi:nicotinate-nucleotide pyrophosphorylase